ncbi:hypothetical protein D0T12_30480 [Actinomadura spongiicola]|uniref:Uncharacterized protein n=1 Tax=Actinomadura spongiicola TaxID=2303421 RepID=A0A372G8A1_9ACTN|nr:hypothetical protein D0T12_30480 [Actinomadura spongiicola]
MIRQANEPTVDPSGLSPAQRRGAACVVCHKRWPRPRVRVGHLPDSTGVFACDDCAPIPPPPRFPPALRARRGSRKPPTDAGRPIEAGPTTMTPSPRLWTGDLWTGATVRGLRSV